jgi:hypothetical protein
MKCRGDEDLYMFTNDSNTVTTTATTSDEGGDKKLSKVKNKARQSTPRMKPAKPNR